MDSANHEGERKIKQNKHDPLLQQHETRLTIHRCLFFALDDFALLGAASGRPSVVAGETVWRGMSFLPAVVMEDSFFPNVRCRVVIVGRRTV